MAIHFPEMPTTRSETPVLKPISCLSEAECATIDATTMLTVARNRQLNLPYPQNFHVKF